MDLDLNKLIVELGRTVGVQRKRGFSKILRKTDAALLLGMLFLFTASTTLAQNNTDKCRGYDNFVKCRQEQLKKSAALQGKSLAGAQAALYQLNSTKYKAFLTSDSKKQKHLQSIQASARKVRESAIKGVDKIISAYKRRQAAMRAPRQ